MIERIRIKNNKNVDRCYLKDIPAFKNGKEYTFTDGVNIIVGENGCGKSTLINLLKDYLSVDGEWCGRGLYGKSKHKIIKNLFSLKEEPVMYDGVEVFADYRLNTFCLTPFVERDLSEMLETGRFSDMSLQMDTQILSSGQKTMAALYTLFEKMFSK